MRSTLPVRAGVAVAIVVVIAAAVSTARGASAAPKVEAWGLTPDTLATSAVPKARAGKKLIVDARNFVANDNDINPSGPSQGDQITVWATLYKGAKTAGTFQAAETATQVAPSSNPNGFTGKLLVTAVALVAGGQISVVAVANFGQSASTKAAIVGGTGAYKNARGEMIATEGPNGATRLTFYITR
jgi:hypothetical protein